MNLNTSHTVIHLSISAPDALTLPVLVELDDQEHPIISLSVAKYARHLQRQGTWSYEYISKTVSAIGLLRDYYTLEKEGASLGPGYLQDLLEEFLFAVDHGTVLGWRPASNKKYIQIRQSTGEYVKWLITNSLNAFGKSETQFIETCTRSYKSTLHAEKSLLFHTKKRDKRKTGGTRKNVNGLKRYKPFPPNLVQELIDSTVNPRDKLIFALLAYGGRRASELLHLFLEDFMAAGNEAHVELRDPEWARMTWTNAAGKQVRGQRREYLKTIFGLLPRNRHGRRASAVGWKGILFDDEDACTSQMYWIRDAGPFILELHRRYLHEVRPQVPKKRHPYYFVDEEGNPLKMKALRRQFELACARLEKKYGISLEGYGPHSLRHFYGFYCADRLKSDLMLIQKWMGHKQLSSTAIYAHISPETAAKALKEAEKRRKGLQITEEDRKEITNQFASVEFPTLQLLSQMGTTPFGRLDKSKMSRRLK